MDKIINWFMMLIIFVFDPLAIAMVVAANMAFAKIKPEEDVKEYFVYHNEDTVTEEEVMEVLEEEVECSVPEGAEWGKSYPLTDHFDPSDVDELEHWEDEDYVGATLEEQAKHTDWEEEAEKEVVVEKEVIKVEPPKNTYRSPWGNPGGKKR